MAFITGHENLDPSESSSHQAEDFSTSTSMPVPRTDEISPAPEGDLYSADDDQVYAEKHDMTGDGHPPDSKTKKEKAGFEDAIVGEAAPPPYTPAIEDSVKKFFWIRKRILFAAILMLVLLVIVLAIVLGVTLSRKQGGSVTTSSGTSPGSNPIYPTSTRPTSPSSTAHAGNASPPIRNTALSAVSIQDPTSSSTTPLVQIFFQDSDYYLCSKTSTSGVEIWPLSDSGTRLQLAWNSTPIAAVHQPDHQIPIRVFFINSFGYLADMYQSTWGGEWNNGSLVDRQFKVGEQFFGEGSNAISADWCSFEDATVYAMGQSDSRIYGFQSSGEDAEGNGGVWSVVYRSEEFYNGVAINTAAVCVLSIDPAPPMLFSNQFQNIDYTGQVIYVINGTNVTIPLPQNVAARFRPDSPIAAIYGDLGSSDGSANNTLLLFFPLPVDVNSISPNPSLHTLSAEPYWSAKAPLGDSFVATMYSLNWTGTQLYDTGIVPYARGAAALGQDQNKNDTGPDLIVDNSVADTMPRAWMPLAVGGRVMVLYQGDNGGIQIADAIGGNGNFSVITGAR